MDEPLEGIAAADAILGRPFPLPDLVLPLPRWVDVLPVGAGAEVAWSLDDSRPGAPGRLALDAGTAAPPEREALREAAVRELPLHGVAARLREAALAEAEPSLRPVRELAWEHGGLHLRLTGQGPWALEDLLAVAAAVPG